MRFPALLVSDLHLTDSPRDEYRWSLFPWLQQQCRDERVHTLAILGDLTDRKDYHSATLTNRVAHEIRALTEWVQEVKIIPGNHDWLLGGEEFFRFLSIIPKVSYMPRPTEDPDPKGVLTYYLPFSKNPARDWADFDLSHYELVLMHQTVSGAIASNGERMDGESLPDLSKPRKVYSGDIHVPQTIGPVEYVGSPYHVHFGDSFKPRCVLIEKNWNAVDLHFNSPRRVSVRVNSAADARDLPLRAGDHVKVTIELPESERHEWARVRRDVVAVFRERGAEVFGVALELRRSDRRVLLSRDDRRSIAAPEDAVLEHVTREELGASALDAAIEVMKA